MTENSLFTNVEIDNFRNKGFVIVRSLYSIGEMSMVKSHILELLKEPIQPDKQMVYLEDNLNLSGQKQVSRIENFLPFNSELNALFNDERMMLRLSDLFGEEAVLFKDKINYKLAGEGEATPHQDMQSNWADYADFFISVQICIDENTLENGCLQVCPSSNKIGLIGKRWEPLSKEITKKMEFINFTAKPGDCIFFDCYAPHKSSPNMSKVSRSNIYLSYNPLSQGDHRELYLKEKRNDFPPDNERINGQTYKYRV